MSNLEDARKTLRDFLDDMSALKQFADPGNPEAGPFVNAFAIARQHALAAAAVYAAAATESD